MKIAISVFGRFHIFNTAKELSKRKVLNQFFTSYPNSEVRKWGITARKKNTWPLLGFLNWVRSRYLSKYFSDSIFLKKIYDKLISFNLDRSNQIYVSWGGYAYDSMRKAKSFNIPIVLEYGSSHPCYIVEVLQQEYGIVGSSKKVSLKDSLHWQLKTIEMSNYISIPSSFVKRTFIEYGVPEEKLLVNPYGVDLSSFRQIEKEDDVFRVIFCGTLSLRKGSHYLLEAFYGLELENIELWHIGNVLDEMKPFIRQHASKNIIYKGSYHQSELYKLYSQGSVFVMPSIEEGMAMVQLQAMACGLPLICTTNTGGDDLITEDGKEGFVIPIRSVEAIQEKITFLYHNEDLRLQMSNNAKERVSSGFTWDDYGNRYMKNLEMVFEKNKQ